jgi:hypothetical protein
VLSDSKDRPFLLLTSPEMGPVFKVLQVRLEPLFATDGTHKDRQWTLRNVSERLAAIRREKIAMGAVEFEKVTTPEPDQQTILEYLKVRL